MVFFSSILRENPKYFELLKGALFAALRANKISFSYVLNTCDIWVRDFMPVKTKSGKIISFRYEPSYLENNPELRTDFKQDIAVELYVNEVTYFDINLDGGNVIFSPSKDKAIISDRVFSENPGCEHNKLVSELEQLLETKIIIISSLKSDMTGHTDGMVRFVDENTVVGNKTGDKFEDEIKSVLQQYGITVIDFPYFDSNDLKGIGSVGCYINFSGSTAKVVEMV